MRRAYQLAEGDVLDVQGFIDLFAEDGVFNGIGDVSGRESYRGEQLGDVVISMGKMVPDCDDLGVAVVAKGLDSYDHRLGA